MKCHPWEISDKPSSPTKDTFHKERSMRVGQPRAISFISVYICEHVWQKIRRENKRNKIYT